MRTIDERGEENDADDDDEEVVEEYGSNS